MRLFFFTKQTFTSLRAAIVLLLTPVSGVMVHTHSTESAEGVKVKSVSFQSPNTQKHMGVQRSTY